MEYIDEIKGPLNAMLYPARWKGLRRNEIDRVMTSLVHAWLFKYSPQWYLHKIREILALEDNLEEYVPERHESETNQNIREFLQDLALEIERQYPYVARSGRRAMTSGCWISEESPGNVIEIISDQELPYVNGREIVWELKELPLETAADALLDDFQKFYHLKTMKGKIGYDTPIDLAHFSVSRFKKRYSESMCREIADLLEVMAGDKSHSMHRSIEIGTEHDFTGNDHRWNWYVGLLKNIRDGLISTSIHAHKRTI